MLVLLFMNCKSKKKIEIIVYCCKQIKKVYDILNIPKELYTPLFAAARMAGWCAHRLENIVVEKKIIRPAYQDVCEKAEYIPLEAR